MLKVKASEFTEIFQTKKEFLMILKEGGNLLNRFVSLTYFLDYYIPPKRDVNYFFMK